MFTRFSHFYLCWPSTTFDPIKIKINQEVNMVNFHTKCKFHPPLEYCVIMFTKFHSLIYGDPVWSLIQFKNNSCQELNTVHLHTKFTVHPLLEYWVFMFTMFSVWPLVTQYDLWSQPKQKQMQLRTEYGASAYQLWSSSNFLIVSYHVNKPKGHIHTHACTIMTAMISFVFSKE